eukprot:GHVQ01014438.1.p1 GENE.GHVQ01014438.1~~GHVQ01014438.1.p1  ORF type:complete len:695 (+),score=137.80 GHVQ01014438.1:321-2405(+)
MAIEFDPTDFVCDDLADDIDSLSAFDEAGSSLSTAADTSSQDSHQRWTPLHKKAAVLFVVDCTIDLFVTREIEKEQSSHQQTTEGGEGLNTYPTVVEKTNYWKEILHSAAQFFRRSIVSDENNKMCFLLFNTGVTNNSLNFPGLNVFLDMDFPDAQRIRALETLSDSVVSVHDFHKRFGIPSRADPPAFGDVFWLAKELFGDDGKRVDGGGGDGGKRKGGGAYRNKVMIFSTRDDPCSTETDCRRCMAITRAKDLQQDIASVEVIPLVPSDGGTFDLSKFYGPLVLAEGEAVGEYMQGAQVRLEQLQETIRKKEFCQRLTKRADMTICEGVTLSVGVYTHVMYSRIPSPVLLNAQDNKPLKSETRWLCEETSVQLAPADILTYIEYEHEKVLITKQDKDTLRFGYPDHILPDGAGEMLLLGFTDNTDVKMQDNIFHPYFLRPLETRIAGSDGLFAALLVAMLDTQQVAIVRWIPDRRGHPVMAALLPQAEEATDEGYVIYPAGLLLVPLPYAQDIRSIYCPPSTVPDTAQEEQLEEQVEAVCKVLEGLLLEEFDPELVKNPKLQKHFAGIETLALGQDEPHDPGDDIQPNSAALQKMLPKILKWKQSVYGSDDLLYVPRAAAKRNYNRCDDSPQAEKRAAAAPSDAVLLDHSRADTMNRLTVPQLREALVQRGLSGAGTKLTLINRIEGYIATA